MSPNVGHLILKYLCPAVRDILSDGLKAYVLDMIIGQRRNIPWSVVEASTQLGMEDVLCGTAVLWLGGAGEGPNFPITGPSSEKKPRQKKKKFFSCHPEFLGCF